MNCPECGSSEIRKCSVIYEQGTSYGHTETPGWRIERFSQTPLAERCAPPQKPAGGVFKAVISALCVAFFAWAGYKAVMAFKLSFHWTLWPIAGGFFILLGAARIFWYAFLGKTKKARYKDLYAAWERSWLCLKCGKIFTEEPEPGG